MAEAIFVTGKYGSTDVYKAVEVSKDNEANVKAVLPTEHEVKSLDTDQMIIITATQSKIVPFGHFLLMTNLKSFDIVSRDEYLSSYQAVQTKNSEAAKVIHAPRSGGSVQQAVNQAKK